MGLRMFSYHRIFLKIMCWSGLVWGSLVLGACQKKAPERVVGEARSEVEAPRAESAEQRLNQGGGPPVADDVLARGEYLVNTVMACGDCHTPRDVHGEFRKDMLLAGTPNFADLVPGDPERGAISAPNLTPSVEHGLGRWTAEQMKEAIVRGVAANGEPLYPVMPYWLYHNLSDEDADAIVAYLRSIPAVDNELPPNQPMATKLRTPAPGLGLDQFPQLVLQPGDTMYEEARRGQYLVAIAACADCHTQETESPIPIELNKILAGGRTFSAAGLGLMSPPFPMTIYSTNLTPDKNGLQGWTAEDVRVALKDGLDREGRGICPPMPSGPHGSYAGLHDQDALAIGHYLLNIPPTDNGVIEACAGPAPE